MVTPKVFIGWVQICSTFDAAVYPAAALEPKELIARWIAITPIAVIENWKAIGRPIFKCSPIRDQFSFQSPF